MPVVSQSIIRPMVPVGASTEACELRTPTSAASSHASSHDCWAAESRSCGHELLVDVGGGGAVLVEHAEHVLGVLGVAGERAHAGGGAGRGGVGVAGHERR